jgi:NAD(P)-dependent dehydrogenase (short-subunit alcohol dehydrogenase family)
MELRGKTALITGGTSGIGAATVRAFAGAGARILFTGRDQARGARVRDECGGADVAFLAGDLGDAAFTNSLVPEAVRRMGRLDILVNNAGLLHRTAPIDTSDAQWREMFGVNVDAVFVLSRAAVTAMRAAKTPGTIVNVASEVSLVGAKGLGAYAATKGAVALLTRSMALDHAEEGIRINAVCPGEVHTAMLESAIAQRGMAVPEGLARLASHVPMKRVAAPEEIADAILFLASSRASFITGTLLSVDGGSTAR